MHEKAIPCQHTGVPQLLSQQGLQSDPALISTNLITPHKAKQ